MTTTAPNPASSTTAAPPPQPPPAADAFATPVPVANAALVGVPTFMVGSIALALNLTDYVPQAVVGAPIAIIAMATGIGQLIATIFALRAGESAVACVFGIFTGFWLSYAALVLGLVHNWYGLGTGANDTVKTFLLSWLILIVLLTLAGIRLPLAFTVLFVLVDLALLFVYLGYVNIDSAGVPSKGLLQTGGYFVWAFVAVGGYLFLDAMSGDRRQELAPRPAGPPLTALRSRTPAARRSDSGLRRCPSSRRRRPPRPVG